MGSLVLDRDFAAPIECTHAAEESETRHVRADDANALMTVETGQIERMEVDGEGLDQARRADVETRGQGHDRPLRDANFVSHSAAAADAEDHRVTLLAEVVVVALAVRTLATGREGLDPDRCPVIEQAREFVAHREGQRPAQHRQIYIGLADRGRFRAHANAVTGSVEVSGIGVDSNRFDSMRGATYAFHVPEYDSRRRSRFSSRLGWRRHGACVTMPAERIAEGDRALALSAPTRQQDGLETHFYLIFKYFRTTIQS